MSGNTTLIPECITSCIDFIELNEASQRSLYSMLHYCIEIEEKTINWLSNPKETLGIFLDDLELDCFAIISTGFGDPENYVSTYNFHSSWTFECQKKTLNELITKDVRTLFNKTLPNFNASADDLVLWIREWCVTLTRAIKSFITAQNFDLAITAMITIDSLILAMLSVTSITRLNPYVFD